MQCVLKMAPIFRQTDMIEVLQGIGQPRTNMIYDPPCQNLFSFAINDHTVTQRSLITFSVPDTISCDYFL